jgi:hypothetical protein
MIAKGCSLRNPGDIASSGRNVVVKGKTISPVSEFFVEYARKVAKPPAKQN